MGKKAGAEEDTKTTNIYGEIEKTIGVEEPELSLALKPYLLMDFPKSHKKRVPGLAIG